MVRRTIWLAALVGGLLGVNEARAQIGAGAATAATPSVARPGLLEPPLQLRTAGPQAGFFARMCDNLEQCRRKLCAQAGRQLLNSLTAPATAADRRRSTRSVQSCPVKDLATRRPGRPKPRR